MTVISRSFSRFSMLPRCTMARIHSPSIGPGVTRNFSNIPPYIPTKWTSHSRPPMGFSEVPLNIKASRFSKKQATAYAGLALVVGGFATYHLLGEKSYTKEEVGEHNSKEKGIWVTYRQGVYDISRFVSLHPGGDVFAKVAGKAIDDDWAALPFHAKGPAKKLLEEMRIGKVKGDFSDTLKIFLSSVGLGGLFPSEVNGRSDPYANDPQRNFQLTVRNEKPYNADPTPKDLSKSFLTEKEHLYVRNHYPIPQINREDYRLHMMIGGKDFVFSIEDLKTKYEQVSVNMVQACAGNRRATLPGTSGTPWDAAVGNVCYGGPRLLDVMSDMVKEEEYDEEDLAEMHLYITGMDHSPSGVHYNTSIAWNKIPSDALLALTMNGEELTPDHGFPLRAVFPGLAGHYSIKFPDKMMLIYRDRIEKEEKFEKKFSEEVAADLSLSRAQRSYVKYDESDQIIGFADKLLVQSQILDVEVSKDTVFVKGYAHGERGAVLEKLEVSCDEGKTWLEAQIEKHESNADVKKWGWSFWSIKIPRKDIPKGCAKIVSRASDKEGNIQPERPLFNKRGLAANGWGSSEPSSI